MFGSLSSDMFVTVVHGGPSHRLTFETARKLRGVPSLVFAHSLGNNVFRYFLEWLKLEIAPKMYIKWIDDHIKSYYAVGPHHLQRTV